MVELAEIFRIHGPAYLAKYGDRMPDQHLKAMLDIVQCRTEALGGQVYFCEHCGEYHYSYHSCRNRHCPKCQNDAAEEWLQNQSDLLLPVPHFMVSFTLPDELRELARSHQKLIYHLLFQASSAALQTLAQDPRFVGGKLGMVGVLQTWTRDLRYHPHIHYIIPGGGLSPTGEWMPARTTFLMPVQALSIIFRAKFRDALKKTNLYLDVPNQVWQKDWVVHCQPVGSGQEAFQYLAPYIFRVALCNNHILKLEHGEVTFQYKDPHTGKLKTQTIPAEEFIRRFLQHILPHRFVKVRYYGLFASTNRPLLTTVRQQLATQTAPTAQKTTPKEKTTGRCPNCGNIMTIVGELPRKRGKPP